MTRATSLFARAHADALERDPTLRPSLPFDSAREYLWCPEAQELAASRYYVYRDATLQPISWTAYLRVYYPAWTGLPLEQSANPTIAMIRQLRDYVPIPKVGPLFKVRARPYGARRRRVRSSRPSAVAVRAVGAPEVIDLISDDDVSDSSVAAAASSPSVLPPFPPFRVSLLPPLVPVSEFILPPDAFVVPSPVLALRSPSPPSPLPDPPPPLRAPTLASVAGVLAASSFSDPSRSPSPPVFLPRPSRMRSPPVESESDFDE